MPPDWQPDLLNLGRLVIAMLLGGVIGLEREAAHRPAGLRTHMLVGGSAALLVAVGNALFERYLARGDVVSDPLRLIEAIIVGISFLGAGTIFRNRAAAGAPVEGLTTAASILYTTVVGVAVAIDEFVLAAGATLLALVVNLGLRNISKRI